MGHNTRVVRAKGYSVPLSEWDKALPELCLLAQDQHLIKRRCKHHQRGRREFLAGIRKQMNTVENDKIVKRDAVDTEEWNEDRRHLKEILESERDIPDEKKDDSKDMDGIPLYDNDLGCPQSCGTSYLQLPIEDHISPEEWLADDLDSDSSSRSKSQSSSSCDSSSASSSSSSQSKVYLSVITLILRVILCVGFFCRRQKNRALECWNNQTTHKPSTLESPGYSYTSKASRQKRSATSKLFKTTNIIHSDLVSVWRLLSKIIGLRASMTAKTLLCLIIHIMKHHRKSGTRLSLRRTNSTDN